MSINGAFIKAHRKYREWWEKNRCGLLDIWDEVEV